MQQYDSFIRLMKKGIMKQIVTLTLIGCFCLALTACSSEPNFRKYGGDTPLEDLPWVQEIINDGGDFQQEYGWVLRFEYKRETYITFGNCCVTCLSMPPVYWTCEGDIFEFSEEERSEIETQLMEKTDSELIFCGTTCVCAE